MSDKKKKGISSLLRPLQDAWLDGWSRVAARAVESDTLNSMTGRSINLYLRTVEPIQHIFEKSFEQTLHRMQLPTRTEFASLSNRMTHIEKKLDDITALLEEIKRGKDD
jgi:hypothetical protein